MHTTAIHLFGVDNPATAGRRLPAVAATTPVTVEAHESQNHWHTRGTPVVESMGMSTSDAVIKQERSRSSW